MKRTLGVVLGIGGLVLVVLGLVSSSTDSAAIKFGAMGGGVVLAIIGIALFSAVKPEPIVRNRSYKEPGKLDFDADGTSGASEHSGDANGDKKAAKGKVYDL